MLKGVRHCTECLSVNSMIKTSLSEADHSIRSGCRLMDTISAGKQSLWSKFASIYQFRGLPNRTVVGLMVVGFIGPSPFQTNVFACQQGDGDGRAVPLVDFPALLEDILTPGCAPGVLAFSMFFTSAGEH